MSNPTLSVSKSTGITPFLGGLTRNAVLAQLRRLSQGHLRVLSKGQQWSFGDPASQLQAEVEILEDATWNLIAATRSTSSRSGLRGGGAESRRNLPSRSASSSSSETAASTLASLQMLKRTCLSSRSSCR